LYVVAVYGDIVWLGVLLFLCSLTNLKLYSNCQRQRHIHTEKLVLKIYALN